MVLKALFVVTFGLLYMAMYKIRKLRQEVQALKNENKMWAEYKEEVEAWSELCEEGKKRMRIE